MYYYVVNPAAGRGQIKNLQDKLRTRLDGLGIRGEWVKTTGPGDATKLTKAAVAAGHTTIVAVGGDDTVNEVINGIDTPDVAVGIIPIGTTNRVASQLGIVHWQQACEALAARRLTPYSLIAAGQKFFLSTLTLGFETDLDKTVDTAAPPSLSASPTAASASSPKRSLPTSKMPSAPASSVQSVVSTTTHIARRTEVTKPFKKCTITTFKILIRNH
jgi:diacylglycerol kinase family enzyme